MRKLKTSLKHFLDLTFYKSFAELRSEAERTYAGYAWWVLEPIIQMAIYFVVFALFLRRSTPDYVPFLLVGLVVWRWFSSMVLVGSYSIISGRSLIHQVAVPKVLFPATVIVTTSFKFLIVFALLLIFLVAYGFPVGKDWLALLALIPIQLLFNSSVTLLTAAVTPFAPDIRITFDNLLRGLFFLSGVFYSGADLPERFRIFFYLNPMAVLIESYRDILLHGAPPHWARLGGILMVALVGSIGGVLLIRTNEYLYPKVIR